MKNDLILKKIFGSIFFIIIIIVFFINKWYWFTGITIIIWLSFVFTGQKEYDEIQKKKKEKKEFKNQTIDSNYSISTDVDKIALKVLSENVSIGMYNMEKSEYYKDLMVDELQDYHFLLGTCFQGRLDELNDVFSEITNKKTIYGNDISEKFVKLINEQKKDLKKACLIAKKYNEKEIGKDMKNGESIGEYFDRKLSKNKTFMKIFTEINKFEYENYFNK